jgi:adenylosuccinate lyase
MEEYLKKKKTVYADEVLLFSKDYTEMSEEKTEKFLNEVLVLDFKQNKLRDNYFKKIRKILSAKQILKLMQLDDYLETYRKYKISNALPWVKLD